MTALSAPAPRNDVLLRLGRLGLCASLFLSSLLVVRVGGDYTAGDIVLVLAVGVTVFAVAAQRLPATERVLPVATIVTIALIGGGGVLSGLRAQSVTSTLAVVVRLLLVALVLPWLARSVLPAARDVRRGIAAFAYGCGASGGGTILQFLFGASTIPGTGVTDAGRFAGFTQNVSDTGGVCCAGVVLSLALLVTASTGRARILPIASLVGAGFGLLLSGSVSGLVSTAVGFVVLLLARVLRPRTAIVSLIAFALLATLAVNIQTDAGALNPIQRILQTTGNSADDRYNTAGSRVDTYSEALRKIGEHPVVGAGLDPNSTIVDGIYPAHNLFIAAAYCGGVLLLAGIVLAVARPLVAGGVRRLREPHVGTAVAGVVTEFVFAMTAPSLYNRYFWIPLALLVAALALRPAGPLVSRLPARPAMRGRIVRPLYRDAEAAFLAAGDPVAHRPARHGRW